MNSYEVCYVEILSLKPNCDLKEESYEYPRHPCELSRKVYEFPFVWSHLLPLR